MHANIARLCALGLLLATPASALPLPGGPDDHFLCYKAKRAPGTPKFAGTTVQLSDLFESKDFDAKKLKWLCTPAEKNFDPVVDAATHLAGYKIKAVKDEPKHVPQTPDPGVFNQFGGSQLTTVKEDLLLVPTAKDLDGPPALPGPNDVDHYKCYKAKITPQTPKFLGTTVTIGDQFTATDAPGDGRKLLSLKKPKHLCTPVNKNGEGIKNPQGLLTCYKAKPAKGEPAHVARTGVQLNNQLGALTVETTKEAELCVPSIFQPLLAERFTDDVPSPAEPPNTPGSPGVVVSNPKLLTQFGGSGFSLNNTRYTRYGWDVGGDAPHAVLILIPGFEGGAGGFKILAENLLMHALSAHGLVLEIWAYDRRSNQLEDTIGSDIAELAEDPLVALDWYFGNELGLTLHPYLAAGPNRRAVFYDQGDVPFMAEWTPLTFSRDIDVLVELARGVAQNQNVFLGGHSAGTGFAARYAATDFNLTGVGPAEPGYAKLRGLALIEGGGGSTGGTPLSADSLDRIEAKFDGGLFGAVRDNAGRCVDGVTPCTIANEAVACAAQTPPKCTPPTQAYTVFLGLLNPRIFAAVEPAAIQGINDRDSGQVILQVDQGSPGNNALDKVPQLAGLKGFPVNLPPATVEGAIGTFLDDDGLVANAASFVSTSLGAGGPTVASLKTWLDSTEGPFPPSAVPNNGPAPTALPAGRWGVEKEVTFFPRLLTTFYDGGTNFADWYYPASGLSVTSASGICDGSVCTAGNVGASCTTDGECAQAINLDSTALSVGRGRRDIENLTQAANIDIPVIGLGGSNGLTPVGASFLAFAQSIAPCAAPSCDGTPRVVDAALPNPAFPTYGNAAGGFEAHISEGYAHVDVLTATDDADNHVVAPLVEFLHRNIQ